MRRLIMLAAASSPALLHAQYRIVSTPLSAVRSWDYVVPDPSNHRVFIARQNRVMVIDENDGKLIGEVRDIHGAHGTAIAEKSGRRLRDVRQRQLDRQRSTSRRSACSAACTPPRTPTPSCTIPRPTACSH